MEKLRVPMCRITKDPAYKILLKLMKKEILSKHCQRRIIFDPNLRKLIHSFFSVAKKLSHSLHALSKGLPLRLMLMKIPFLSR